MRKTYSDIWRHVTKFQFSACLILDGIETWLDFQGRVQHILFSFHSEQLLHWRTPGTLEDTSFSFTLHRIVGRWRLSLTSFLRTVILSTFYAGMRDRRKVKHSSKVQGTVYLQRWPVYKLFLISYLKTRDSIPLNHAFQHCSVDYLLLSIILLLNKMSRLLDRPTYWQFYAPERWNSQKHSTKISRPR